jgi:hypothetical protein
MRYPLDAVAKAAKMNPNHELRVMLCATSIILLCTLGIFSIWDKTMKPPIVTACTVEFKGYDGNNHVYVGQGEIW